MYFLFFYAYYCLLTLKERVVIASIVVLEVERRRCALLIRHHLAAPLARLGIDGEVIIDHHARRLGAALVERANRASALVALLCGSAIHHAAQISPVHVHLRPDPRQRPQHPRQIWYETLANQHVPTHWDHWPAPLLAVALQVGWQCRSLHVGCLTGQSLQALNPTSREPNLFGALTT